MTTYAYNFLSETQKEQICFLEICHEKSKARLAIDFYERCSISHYIFEYEQFGTTTVITHNYHKGEIEVEDSNIWTVFCSDLETFLKNQKVRLVYFKIITSKPKSYQGEPDLDFIIAKICGCVEKSRVQKLQVENLIFTPSKSSQLTRILNMMELKKLERAFISLEFENESMDIRKLLELEEFQDAAPSNLDVFKEDVTLMDLIVVKEMILKSTTIRQLELRCVKIDSVGLNLLFGNPILPDKNSLTEHRTIPIPDSHNDKLITILESVDSPSCIWVIDFYRQRFFEKTKHLMKIEILTGEEDLSEIFDTMFTETKKSILAVFGNPLVLAKITELLAFFDIQSLQSVSTLLRNIMAIVKPDPKIDKIQIQLQHFGAIVLGVRVGKPLHRQVVYLEQKVDHLHQRRIITPDCHSKCLEDLARILKFQNAPLKKFKLFFSPLLPVRQSGYHDMGMISSDDLIAQFDEFVEKFTKTLAARDQKLKVELLDMAVFNENNTVKIMKNLEPGALKMIKMEPYQIFVTVNRFNIDELSDLEQWKQAEELCMVNVVITSGFEGLTHFTKARIEVEEINAENLIYLKEKLLESRKLIKYEVNFKSTTINDSIFDLIGPPYARPDDSMAHSRKAWYFRYPDSNDVLLMLFFIEMNRVNFSRVDIDDVPGDAFL